MKSNLADSVAEYRDHIAKALFLERDLIGQLVFSDYEDIQSDWSLVVDELAAWMYQKALEAQVDTAREILHRGYCIPDMEVQVEDFISVLQAQQQQSKPDDYNLEDVTLCKNCNQMKHVNADGYCGRCSKAKGSEYEQH
jgi:hypothetical protein